LVSLL